MEKMTEFPQRSFPQQEHTARRRRRKRRRWVPVICLLLGLLAGFFLGRISAASVPEAEIPAEEIRGAVPEVTEPDDVREETSWELLLVNGENPLQQDFQVSELMKLQNGHAVDTRAYPALQAMMDAARADGLKPLICSSYRTWDKQAELFERKVQYYRRQGLPQEEAEVQAAQWVARPGTSEHETGLAVDIVDESYQMLDEAQERTAVQQWLMEHCAEYGFVLRYPPEKSELTGVHYEPWHYRYVGEAAAKEMTEQRLCLEEYLARSNT